MKKYDYSPEERETIIIWNEAHDVISISTWDKDFGAKLRTVWDFAPDLFIDPIRCTPDGLTECKLTYRMGFCTIEMPISNAQREARSKNMKAINSKKKGTQDELR